MNNPNDGESLMSDVYLYEMPKGMGVYYPFLPFDEESALAPDWRCRQEEQSVIDILTLKRMSGTHLNLLERGERRRMASVGRIRGSSSGATRSAGSSIQFRATRNTKEKGRARA